MKKYIWTVLTVIISLSVIISSVLIPISLIASADATEIDYSKFTGRQTWKFDTAPENENFQVNMKSAGVDTDKGYFYAPTNWTQTQPINYEFKSGHRYVVNFKWKVSAKPTDGFKLQLRNGDTAFKDYGWISSPPTEWQTDRIDFTATNTGLLKIFLDAGTGQTFYVDTVSVYEVGSAVRFDLSDDTQLKAKYQDTNNGYSIELTNNNTVSAKLVKQWSTGCQFVPDYIIENGLKYHVTFKYKINTTMSGNVVNISYHKGSDNVWNAYSSTTGFATPQLNAAAANTWYTSEFEFTAENDANYPYIDFLLRTTKPATYEFDDITIKQVGNSNVGDIILDTMDGNTQKLDTSDAEVGSDYTLPVPKRSGYQFIAWYSDKELTQRITTVKVPEKGNTVTVYAEWERQSSYLLDFEKDADLDLGTSWNGDCVPKIENNELHLRGSASKNPSYARLPIFLSEGTYKYSFKYKANPVNSGDTYTLFMYAGLNGATNQNELNAPFSSANAVSVFNAQALSTGDEYVTQSGTFTVTDNMISDTANKLTLRISTKERYDELYIDDFTLNMVMPVKVSFETNGGDIIEAATIPGGDSIALPSPKKAGMTLEGWYDNAQFLNKVGNGGETYTVPENIEGITLYAKWTEKSDWLFDFESKDDLDIGTSWYGGYQPTVADDNGNGTLYIKGNKGNNNCVARLPFALGEGKTYSYSFDYKTSPVAEGDSYNVSLAIVDNTATDNTTLAAGKRLSTPLSFVKIDTKGEYKNVFGTFTVAEGAVPHDLNRLGILVKTSKQDDDIWIDNFSIKEVSAPSFTASKTYDFNDATGILSPAAGTTLSNGALVFESNWAKYMSLDYLLKDNQSYTITVYYKVELKEGQDYQSFRLLYDYGTSSSHDYKTQTISNSGWIAGKNKEYTDLVNTFTVKTTGIEEGKCFLWLGFDADPGTDKDSAKKGGGKLIIDKIVVSEKDEVKYTPEKTFNFEDKGELLSIPSGSEVKNGEMIFPCSWGKWLGLQYLLKNDQDYEITIKYKVAMASGQESQSINLATAYGTESKKINNITDFGWQQFTNTEYDTFVAKFKVTPNMVSAGSNYLWLYLNANPGTDTREDAKKGGGTIYIDSITVKEAKPITKVKKKTWTFDDKSDLLSIPSLATVKDGALVDKCGWGQNLGLAYIFDPNRTYQITVKYKVDTPNQSLHLVLYSGSLTAKKNIMGTIINWKRVSNTSYTTLTYEVDTKPEMFEGGYYYMWLYLNNNPEYNAYLYIDEITVEDMGPLDYRLYGDAIENYDWKPYDEDTEYGDWKDWLIKAIDVNKADSNNVGDNDSSLLIPIIIAGSSVVLVAAIIVFIVLKKKKSNKV